MLPTNFTPGRSAVKSRSDQVRQGRGSVDVGFGGDSPALPPRELQAKLLLPEPAEITARHTQKNVDTLALNTA